MPIADRKFRPARATGCPQQTGFRQKRCRTARAACPPPRRCAAARRHSLLMKFFSATMRNDPKFSLFAVGGIEPAFFEKAAEEFLREILRVVRRLAAAPDVGIERIPVGLADDFQRRRRIGRGLTGREHDRPARVRKHARCITGGRTAVHGGILSILITGNEPVVTIARRSKLRRHVFKYMRARQIISAPPAPLS